MIANKFVSSAFRSIITQPSFLFSAKKKQIELTFRTPYKTILENFTGFSRLITRDVDSVIVVQNRYPPSLHVLPPGFIKLKLNGDVKGVAQEYIHTGGWVIVHTDNSIEINVMDAVEKKEVRADLIDKVQVKEQDTLAGKYIAKARRAASKSISRFLV